MRVIIWLQIFALLGFLKSEIATACTYAQSYGMDNYRHYSTEKRDWLREDGTFVAVVKTEKYGSDKAKPSQYASDDIPENSGRILKFKLKPVRIIQGSPPEKIRVPEMTESEIHYERAYLEKSKMNFDFWDGFQLSAIESSWHGQWTSCGLSGQNIYLEDQYYLIIGKNKDELYGTGIFLWEPIKSPHDPFVDAVASIIAGERPNPLAITPKEFFEQMWGYQQFDVKECPNSPKYKFMSHDAPDHQGVFGLTDKFDFDVSLKAQNFLFTQECKIWDEYLIIERRLTTIGRAVPFSKFGGLDYPVHRFLKITNGMINVDDIPTNYEFTGEKIIPIEKVKSWIREGQAANAR